VLALVSIGRPRPPPAFATSTSTRPHFLDAEAAKRLSGLLSRLAATDPSLREKFETAIVEPLRIALDELREALKAQPVATDNLPADLAGLWVSPDGRARLQVLPKGDPDDTSAIREFVSAVLAVEPNATGPAVMLFEAGNTIVQSFIESNIRRFGDRCTVVDRAAANRRRAAHARAASPRRYRHVGALLGFQYSIEFCQHHRAPGVARRRRRVQDLLHYGLAQWPDGARTINLTRAVMFSAMTTATGFGSLWLSNDPGTSSMGRLMALALICTMAAAVFFQPALMGPPRTPGLEIVPRPFQRLSLFDNVALAGYYGQGRHSRAQAFSGGRAGIWRWSA
jgi:hypothetical protein